MNLNDIYDKANSLSYDDFVNKITTDITSNLVAAEKQIKSVEKASGLPREVLLSSSRETGIVAARHTLLYLLSVNTNLTLSNIGVMINRDHSTVLHAIGRVGKASEKTDPLIWAYSELIK